tara:strand:- start:920 stop:1738 length:819 start_codon:yes stop_codon:yes gene_type:complete
MNIASIDVGMKYLGFCLFRVENDSFKIVKWNTINLCNEKIYKCCGKTKKGEPCNKTAKFFKNNKYCCKIHAKKESFKIPTAELDINKLPKKKFAIIKNICEKYDISTDGIKYKKDYIKRICDVLNKEYFDKVKKINTKTINLVDYGKSLSKNMDKEIHGINIDILLIENQIGPLALRMKTLQGMIMQYFIERKCNIIKEISAFNKLKEFIKDKKTTYAERKKLSILETSKYIQKNIEHSNWIDTFNSHKKKDDLADAFLQGLYYLKANKLIK